MRPKTYHGKSPQSCDRQRGICVDSIDITTASDSVDTAYAGGGPKNRTNTNIENFEISERSYASACHINTIRNKEISENSSNSASSENMNLSSANPRWGNLTY